MVGDNDHPVGVARVAHGIAQRAAGRGPGHAVGVAHGVGRRSGNEGDVDVHAAGVDGIGPAAVAAEAHRLLQHALGYRAADAAAHVVGLNAGDHAAFDVVNQRGMHVKQAAGLDGQPLDAHLGGLSKHLV